MLGAVLKSGTKQLKKTGDQNLRLYPKGSGDLRLCQCCVRVRARSGDSGSGDGGSGDGGSGDGGSGDSGSGDEAESRRQEGAKWRQWKWRQ